MVKNWTGEGRNVEELDRRGKEWLVKEKAGKGSQQNRKMERHYKIEIYTTLFFYLNINNQLPM